MTYTTARRFMRTRRMIVLVVVAIAGLYSLLQEPLSNVLAPRCDAIPELPERVPAEVAAELLALQTRGLLSCPPIPKGIDGLAERAFWGTDGVNSLLVFSFDEAHPVNVQLDYDDEHVHAKGGWPISGLFSSGRPVYRNEAPDGSGVFVVHLGAPRPTTNSVRVHFQGAGIPQAGLEGRDFFTDLENAWNKIRGQSPTTDATKAELAFAIAPKRWSDEVGEWVSPDLANAKGRASVDALIAAPAGGPSPYRVMSGVALGTGVWVAGVVSGTRPSLVLLVPSLAGEDARRMLPSSNELWRTGDNAVSVMSFSFPPLPRGQTVEALYYADAAAADTPGAEPDARWPLVIPAPADAASAEAPAAEATKGTAP